MRILRQEKNGGCRVHILTAEMPLPPKTSILGVTKNKVQLNKMLYGARMDPEFYRHATVGQMHSLTVAGTEDVPVEIVIATVIESRDLSSSHEEADTIIVQHTMTRCMVGEVVSVICDATDVFALLLHFVAEMKPNDQLCMCSTVKERAVIDIMQNVKVHTCIVPDLLAIHAPTGADISDQSNQGGRNC